LLLRVLPFFVVDRCLLFQINVFVESVVVKFRVFDLFFLGPVAICLVENIKHFDRIHNDILLEDVFDDHDGDVRLELEDCGVEMLFWNAVSKKLSRKIFQLLVVRFSRLFVANLEAFQNLFKDWEVVELVHLGKQEKENETPDSSLGKVNRNVTAPGDLMLEDF